MKFAAVEGGGLVVILESERDWNSFEMLFVDAEGRGEGWLAKRLGVLVEEEDWDEFVVPDLADHFTQQIDLVRKALSDAYASAEGGAGQLMIEKEDGETWYGVFNQARLALEGRWKLSRLAEGEELIDPEEVQPERLAAFLRSEFYGRVQMRVFAHTLGSL